MQITSKVKQWDFFLRFAFINQKFHSCFSDVQEGKKQANKHTLFYKKKENFSHHHYLWLQFFFVHSYMD